MSRKSKVSPAQIFLCISIIAFIIAGFIVMVVSEHAPVFAAMKEKGLSAEGTVTGKEERVTTETGRKGRKREVTRQFLTISYNGMSTTPHAEAAAGKPMRPAPHATTISGDVQVGPDEYESHSIGSKVIVTYLPDKPFTPKLMTSVRDYSPFWQIVTAVLLTLTGIATAFLAWKKRRPKVPALPPVLS